MSEVFRLVAEGASNFIWFCMGAYAISGSNRWLLAAIGVWVIRALIVMVATDD